MTLAEPERPWRIAYCVHTNRRSTAGHGEPCFFVSSIGVAKPLLDLAHDFVDLERLQKGRFLFQLCTPCHQDRVDSRLLLIAFINDLLDRHFPFLKSHRLFLLEFGIAGFDR
jgi:hypothetical protein